MKHRKVQQGGRRSSILKTPEKATKLHRHYQPKKSLAVQFAETGLKSEPKTRRYTEIFNKLVFVDDTRSSEYKGYISIAYSKYKDDVLNDANITRRNVTLILIKEMIISKVIRDNILISPTSKGTLMINENSVTANFPCNSLDIFNAIYLYELFYKERKLPMEITLEYDDIQSLAYQIRDPILMLAIYISYEWFGEEYFYKNVNLLYTLLCYHIVADKTGGLLFNVSDLVKGISSNNLVDKLNETFSPPITVEESSGSFSGNWDVSPMGKYDITKIFQNEIDFSSAGMLLSRRRASNNITFNGNTSIAVENMLGLTGKKYESKLSIRPITELKEPGPLEEREQEEGESEGEGVDVTIRQEGKTTETTEKGEGGEEPEKEESEEEGGVGGEGEEGDVGEKGKERIESTPPKTKQEIIIVQPEDTESLTRLLEDEERNRQEQRARGEGSTRQPSVSPKKRGTSGEGVIQSTPSKDPTQSFQLPTERSPFATPLPEVDISITEVLGEETIVEPQSMTLTEVARDTPKILVTPENVTRILNETMNFTQVFNQSAYTADERYTFVRLVLNDIITVLYADVDLHRRSLELFIEAFRLIFASYRDQNDSDEAKAVIYNISSKLQKIYESTNLYKDIETQRNKEIKIKDSRLKDMGIRSKNYERWLHHFISYGLSTVPSMTPELLQKKLTLENYKSVGYNVYDSEADAVTQKKLETINEDISKTFVALITRKQRERYGGQTSKAKLDTRTNQNLSLTPDPSLLFQHNKTKKGGMFHK